ncbi:MAG: DUF4350 domain-containing protein, partial [Candidatus Eremiobacteraeota bacterium]|nr:DUF4350 domain-containing protein [Candidatus Eremiobacteraeota bacterium]
MRTPRLETAIVIAGALVLVLLGYERDATQRRASPSAFSTYDSGPNGYRALFAVLRRAGADVTQFDLPLGILGSQTRTLVISDYEMDDSANALNPHDRSVLTRFVQDGGRLVVLDSEFSGFNVPFAPALGRPIAASERRAIPMVDNRLTLGVGPLAGPVDAVFPYSERYGEPLFGNDAGIVALGYAYGKGEVIAISAPKLFGNAYLRGGGNL